MPTDRPTRAAARRARLATQEAAEVENAGRNCGKRHLRGHTCEICQPLNAKRPREEEEEEEDSEEELDEKEVEAQIKRLEEARKEAQDAADMARKELQAALKAKKVLEASVRTEKSKSDALKLKLTEIRHQAKKARKMISNMKTKMEEMEEKRQSDLKAGWDAMKKVDELFDGCSLCSANTLTYGLYCKHPSHSMCAECWVKQAFKECSYKIILDRDALRKGQSDPFVQGESYPFVLLLQRRDCATRSCCSFCRAGCSDATCVHEEYDHETKEPTKVGRCVNQGADAKVDVGALDEDHMDTRHRQVLIQRGMTAAFRIATGLRGALPFHEVWDSDKLWQKGRLVDKPWEKKDWASDGARKSLVTEIQYGYNGHEVRCPACEQMVFTTVEVPSHEDGGRWKDMKGSIGTGPDGKPPVSLICHDMVKHLLHECSWAGPHLPGQYEQTIINGVTTDVQLRGESQLYFPDYIPGTEVNRVRTADELRKHMKTLAQRYIEDIRLQADLALERCGIESVGSRSRSRPRRQGFVMASALLGGSPIHLPAMIPAVQRPHPRSLAADLAAVAVPPPLNVDAPVDPSAPQTPPPPSS